MPWQLPIASRSASLDTIQSGPAVSMVKICCGKRPASDMTYRYLCIVTNGQERQYKARQGKARQGKASVRSTDTCSQGKATMGTRPNLRWSTSGHVTSARVAPCCAETEESDSRRARLANRPDFVTPARNRLHAARVSPARRQCRFRQGSDTAPHTHACSHDGRRCGCGG